MTDIFPLETKNNVVVQFCPIIPLSSVASTKWPPSELLR